jgi:hypothetical protein
MSIVDRLYFQCRTPSRGRIHRRMGRTSAGDAATCERRVFASGREPTPDPHSTGRYADLPPAGVTLFIVGMCVIVLACGRQLPGAPDDVQLLTISGYVYQQETSEFGEPKLTDVLITVSEGDRSPRTTRSDAVGFYTVSVRTGTISITAAKAGYGTRASSFDMSINMVLNFSLTPTGRDDISGAARPFSGTAPYQQVLRQEVRVMR